MGTFGWSVQDRGTIPITRFALQNGELGQLKMQIDKIARFFPRSGASGSSPVRRSERRAITVALQETSPAGRQTYVNTG